MYLCEESGVKRPAKPHRKKSEPVKTRETLQNPEKYQAPDSSLYEEDGRAEVCPLATKLDAERRASDLWRHSGFAREFERLLKKKGNCQIRRRMRCDADSGFVHLAPQLTRSSRWLSSKLTHRRSTNGSLRSWQKSRGHASVMLRVKCCEKLEVQASSGKAVNAKPLGAGHSRHRLLYRYPNQPLAEQGHLFLASNGELCRAS